MEAMSMKAGGMPEAAPPIEPEQIEVRAQVSVSYRIQ